jgi:hypothetical protein
MPQAPSEPNARAEPAKLTTMLFFGLGTNEGTNIAPAAFDAFVREQVIPRFPDGFTLLDARGQWGEAGIAYAEPSRVLLIVHDDTPKTSEAIDAIREIYKKQFKQTAVLRLDLPVRKVAF